MTIEYSRPAGENIMEFVSIVIGNENVAESMVAAGYATCSPHREDEPRAGNYIKLLKLEFEAKMKKMGVHSNTPYKGRNFDDLSRRKDDPKYQRGKAQKYSTELVNHSHTAIVEFCFSGSRFKVLLPKAGVYITLTLSGVRTPGRGDPYSDESKEWVTQRIQQHGIGVRINNFDDKTESFRGDVTFDGGKTDLATALVQLGYGKIIYTNDQSLRELENKAKEQRIKIWENYVEPVDELLAVEGGDADVTTPLRDQFDAKVVDIVDATHFYIHNLDDKNIPVVEEKMAEFNKSEEHTPVTTPKKGSIIAAKYQLDEAWYRVRYEGRGGVQGQHKVFFIDYGTYLETMEISRLAQLPEELAKIGGLAKSCQLAGLKAPKKTSEYSHDAAAAFNEMAFERDMSCKIELSDRSSKTLHLALTDKEDTSGYTVNEFMLSEGWCRIEERPDPKLKDLCKKYLESQEIAIRERKNVWEYGDVSDEESDDDGTAVRKREDGRPPQRK